jgi:hypothetical protein
MISLDDAFLSVKVGDQERKVKKEQLLWMLQNDKIHINADLRQRFIPRRVISIKTPSSKKTGNVWIEGQICKGDRIVIVTDKKVVISGEVFNFKYLNQKFKKNMIYWKDHVDLESSKAFSKELGLLLDPVNLITSKKGFKMDHNTYFNVNFYKCHINEEIDLNDKNVLKIVKNEIKNIK